MWSIAEQRCSGVASHSSGHPADERGQLRVNVFMLDSGSCFLFVYVSIIPPLPEFVNHLEKYLFSTKEEPGWLAGFVVLECC